MIVEFSYLLPLKLAHASCYYDLKAAMSFTSLSYVEQFYGKISVRNYLKFGQSLVNPVTTTVNVLNTQFSHS